MVPYLQGFGLIPCGLLGILQSAETGQSIWTVWLGILIVFLDCSGIAGLVYCTPCNGKGDGVESCHHFAFPFHMGSIDGDYRNDYRFACNYHYYFLLQAFCAARRR